MLDNLVDAIIPGSERLDILAVYLTDTDGNIIVIKDDGKQRIIAGEIENRKLAK